MVQQPIETLSPKELADLEVSASNSLVEWDKGVFNIDFVRNLPKIAPGLPRKPRTPGLPGVPRLIGSKPQILSSKHIDNARKSLSEIWTRVEQKYGSWYDIGSWESSIPEAVESAKKKETFQWADDSSFPPHLDAIPKAMANPTNPAETAANIIKNLNPFATGKWSTDQIFDTTGFLELLGIIAGPTASLQFYDSATNTTIPGIEGIVLKNQELIRDKSGMFNTDNIGVYDDWYSDSMFAQQQFIGPNPTTIAIASADWVQQFGQEATRQQKADIASYITAQATEKALYVQDYSYFREAIVEAGEHPFPAAENMSFKDPATHETTWNVAAVVLFHLSSLGVLHPLAICIDYKGSLANSVVIFNHRQHALALPDKPTVSTPETIKAYNEEIALQTEVAGEKADWPWRYAKTCAQVSDWVRHEVTIHLTNTHFVEEVVIVAAQRSFTDPGHSVFRLMSAHWYKTLSLNAAARATLVPQVIAKLIGVNNDQAANFINHGYRTFDWTGLYIPTDLSRRGFPVDELETNPKYKNYTYARNMLLMWNQIRTFVNTVVRLEFATDEEVAADKQIQDWVTEMKDPNGGKMPQFPVLNTIDAVVDAVTMVIHIASPQHTAVNYLQNFYQEFVLNKPAGLCVAPPATLAELNGYIEANLFDSVPAKRLADWLLASHVPNLLSMKVAEEQNITNYAKSLFTIIDVDTNPDLAPLKTAAGILLVNLDGFLTAEFIRHAAERDDTRLPYDVMNPKVTANSILI